MSLKHEEFLISPTTVFDHIVRVEDLPFECNDLDEVMYDLARLARYCLKRNINGTNFKQGLLFSTKNHSHEYPFCYRCNTPLIYTKKTEPEIAKFIEKKFGLKVEETTVTRGIVVDATTENGKLIDAIIICPNCKHVNYIGYSRIFQLLLKPFEKLIVKKALELADHRIANMGGVKP